MIVVLLVSGFASSAPNTDTVDHSISSSIDELCESYSTDEPVFLKYGADLYYFSEMLAIKFEMDHIVYFHHDGKHLHKSIVVQFIDCDVNRPMTLRTSPRNPGAKGGSTDLQCDFDEVRYSNLWGGIDLRYIIKDGTLKYEYIIRPNSEVDDIRMGICGADLVSTGDGRELIVQEGPLFYRDSGLTTFYQDSSTTIGSKYVKLSDTVVGFQLDDHEDDRTIVIDPWIYSSYLGGDSFDEANDIVLVHNNSMVIVGETGSSDFPVTEGTIGDFYHGGDSDAFIYMYNLLGNTLTFSLFLGGINQDCIESVAIDPDGNIIVAGWTYSYDFPTTFESYQPDYVGDDSAPCAFVSRISQDGSTLLNSTFIGGTLYDKCVDVQVDMEGRVYCTGYTSSSDFPVSEDALQPSHSSHFDAFLTVLGPDGKGLDYSTYLGGDGRDDGHGIALGQDGNKVYMTGKTASSDFPVTDDALYPSLNGDQDIFVSIIDIATGALEYSTYVGGESADTGHDIALGADGSIVICGSSESQGFPTTADAIQDTKMRFRDCIVTILSPDGSHINYSTFVGGGDAEWAWRMSVRDDSSIVIVGTTGSADYPVTDNAIQSSHGNSLNDAFLTEFRPGEPDILYSTFIGGDDDDYGRGFDLINRSTYIMAGHTRSTNLPITSNAHQPDHNISERHSFVSEFGWDEQNRSPTADAGPDQVVDQHDIVTFNASGSSDENGIVQWRWYFSYDDGVVEVFGNIATFTFDIAGQYSIFLEVTNMMGLSDVDSLDLIVRDTTPPVARAGENITIDQHEVVTFNGAASSDNVGIVHYSWSFEYNGSTVILSGKTAGFQFHEAGDYLVSLEVRDDVPLRSNDTVTVHVNDTTPPTAQAVHLDNVDLFDELTLDGSQSIDNIAIAGYSWTVLHEGEQWTLNGSIVHFMFNDTGTYDVLLTVSDPSGNIGEDGQQVLVRDNVPPVADAGPDIDALVGDRVKFSGVLSTDNVGIVEWKWSSTDGSGIELFGVNATHRFDKAGTYEVTLTVSDEAGNIDSDTVLVVIEDSEVSSSNPYWILLVIVCIAAIIVVVIIYRKHSLMQ